MDDRSQPFRKGDKVGDYVILRLIGKGGQGFVYEGVHEWAGNAVAVKAIPSAVDAAKNISERAKTEARILVNLNHPNILRVHTATATSDGVVCIVTELLKGRSLRMLLREINRLRVEEALLIGAQVAEGTQAAHDFGVIHRDLKPENVYIEPGNLVKVLDFGIAKITGPGAVTTQENLVKGTLQYMSPEQLQVRPLTPSSDIFALGCILYELLSGSTPMHTGAPQTINEAGWMQISHMPPQLNTVCDEIPPYVAHAIQLLLAKEPADRPASMSQVATDLRALYARYTKKVGCTPRELWRSGLHAASPVAFQPVAVPTVTTTVRDGAPHQVAQTEPVEGIAKESDARVDSTLLLTSNATKPLPLLIRSAPSEPAQPATRDSVARVSGVPAARKGAAIAARSVVVRESEVPAPAGPAVEKTAGDQRDQPSLDSQAHPSVGDSERQSASAIQLTPGSAVPVSAAARHSLPPPNIQWHRVVGAVGGGALIGAVALFIVRSTAVHNPVADDPSTHAAPVRVVALTSTPEESAGPAPVPPPSADAPLSATTVAESHTAIEPLASSPTRGLTQNATPGLTTRAPTEHRIVTPTKSTPRKLKASAGKLPFGPDDLTF